MPAMANLVADHEGNGSAVGGLLRSGVAVGSNCGNGVVVASIV